MITIYHAQCVSCGKYVNSMVRLRATYGDVPYKLIDTRIQEEFRDEHARIISAIGNVPTVLVPVVDVHLDGEHTYTELLSW